MPYLPIRQGGATEADGTFGAVAHTRKAVGEHFLGLHIKLATCRETRIDTRGGRSVFKIYNFHYCSPTLFSKGGGQADDEGCGEVLGSPAQYH